jgi:putative sterol carrier protein
MSGATSGFLTALASAEHDSSLGRADGALRIELERNGKTERWFLEVHQGEVTVSRKRVPYDGTIRTTGELFDRMASGEANAMTALLRGEIQVEGDAELLVLVQRLFPSPPRRSTGKPRKGARR